uniref:Uncharacterized protein n=1 Tax=Neisseria meningitidis alpha522 TaxID=996307 RepID=I4E6Y5_NEIME|nr:hypothetical protein NMALPHA522_1562 [Neisseria meningitidis alpha522]
MGKIWNTYMMNMEIQRQIEEQQIKKMKLFQVK